ncbi:IS1595 family transposase [Candidatus Amoebophilus asiaticus]|nr:IS1595 family transposase [Candidatus Amoebophilus asiaticus]
MTEEDYPRNFQEFITYFKNEEDCWNYLFRMRWQNGFSCPRCGSDGYWMINRKMAECNKCGHQTSVTAGTIFHKTRKPLLLWFHVMWWVAAQKTGVSASNFKDFMGFGSYETAWVWLHKLRRTMIRPGRDKLKGEVEVDETYIAGEEFGKRADGKSKTGRGSVMKTLVVVATECNGKQIGRVRFRCIDNASTNNLKEFIKDNIEHDSCVITDGWKGYSFLDDSKDYQHVRKIVANSDQNAHELLPHVHMVDSLLKRWINGTHQGRISTKHLEYYLDEFAFRFNRKLSRHRGKLFYRLIQQSTACAPTTLKEIQQLN